MKKVSYALVTAGLLALAACGSGKGNNTSGNGATGNTTVPTTGDVNTSSDIPSVNTGTSTTNTAGTANTSGTTANNSAANVSTNTTNISATTNKQ